MATKEDNPVSRHQFMLNFRVGRQKLDQALRDLHITNLRLDNGSNKDPVLSDAIQDKVQTYLKLIPPEEREQYHEDGYVTAQELGSVLGLTKSTTFRHLHAVDPDWQDKYPNIAQGQRRVVLLPPGIIDKVDRYHALGFHRHMLASWRSMQTRNALPLYQDKAVEEFCTSNKTLLEQMFNEHNPRAIETYANNIGVVPRFPPDGYKEMIRSIHWFRLAQEIEKSDDIIPLTDKDKQIFSQFKEATELALIRFSLLYAHLPIEYTKQRRNSTWATSHRDLIISEGFRCITEQIIPILEAEIPYSKIRRVLWTRITDHIRLLKNV
jgi:hypothetical protein